MIFPEGHVLIRLVHRVGVLPSPRFHPQLPNQVLCCRSGPLNRNRASFQSISSRQQEMAPLLDNLQLGCWFGVLCLGDSTYCPLGCKTGIRWYVWGMDPAVLMDLDSDSWNPLFSVSRYFMFVDQFIDDSESFQGRMNCIKRRCALSG